nr:unnamed protein product [Spirometra erinaceieuropaei]
MATKAICDADGWTDLRLVIFKLRPRLQPRRKPQGERPPDSDNQLAQHLEDLPAPDDNASVETRWLQLQNVVHPTALSLLGRARH